MTNNRSCWQEVVGGHNRRGYGERERERKKRRERERKMGEKREMWLVIGRYEFQGLSLNEW